MRVRKYLSMVCVSTILLALHTGDDALMAEIDTCLLASKREKGAFGCFLTLRLPQVIDALHQGAFARHRADHGSEPSAKPQAPSVHPEAPSSKINNGCMRQQAPCSHFAGTRHG